jgi:hypothetical protein
MLGMWKLKIFAIVTVILGIISLGWVIYDYLALTDISYNIGNDLVFKRRTVTMGFIPILLFHFFFFATMYLLFDFLKGQKILIKEHKQLVTELENQKAEKEIKGKVEKEKDIKISDAEKPTTSSGGEVKKQETDN